jgi:hypothetical protein
MSPEKLGKPAIRYVGDPKRIVHKVTLDWGSPGAVDILLRALAHGCEASITGRSWNGTMWNFHRRRRHRADHRRHHATETPGMMSFYNWFKPQWPDLRVEYIDAGNPDLFVS